MLPLLGLRPMEVAAENLRQIAKSVEEQAKLKETKGTLKEVETKRGATFGQDNYDQILKKIEGLHRKYCADKATTTDALSRCEELKAAIDMRITGSSGDQKRYIAFQDATARDLKRHVDAVRVSSGKLVCAIEPLIAERLEVLQSTGRFVDRLGSEQEVECPACGQQISVDAFQTHVQTERVRLHEINEVFETRKASIGTLSDTVKGLKSDLGKTDVKSWRAEVAMGPLAEGFAYLDGMNADALRASCGEDDLKSIEDKLLPLVNAAASASMDAPPDTQVLSADKQMVETGQDVITGIEQASAAARAEALVSFITSLEQGIREEIRTRSNMVIDEISEDLQAMWAILHPDRAIEDVHLYLPKNVDKAIEIGLTSYGVKLESPRLTLSEGYRNSLGLCIFLAMAKREADKDRPLFLDDVVISLDRNHRGMIVELLEKEFGARQVVILTHDREWYTELRHQLHDRNWAFKALLPYEPPELGIRWSHKTMTFDDARAQLKERPDAAGNDVRKIMDVELALIAEHLQISLPYLRADKNDKRTAHDFLERFSADGKRCFQTKVGEVYEARTDSIAAFDHADRLLVSWANRASHTFDLVRPEATKLIDACENVLEFFKCYSCGKAVWLARAEKWVQCQCSQIRWRHG